MDSLKKLSTVTDHPLLFEELKLWRKEKANEIDKPAFIILHQKPLIDIVECLPSTLDELIMIKGIGKKKVNLYGNEIIGIVNGYCKDNCIDRENIQVSMENI